MSEVSDTRSGSTAATTSNGISVGRQALRRKVNAQLRAIESSGETTVEIFCECGRRLCADHLSIDLDLFEAVVKSLGQYVVTTDHDDDPTQRLISRHHGFLIVERA